MTNARLCLRATRSSAEPTKRRGCAPLGRTPRHGTHAGFELNGAAEAHGLQPSRSACGVLVQEVENRLLKRFGLVQNAAIPGVLKNVYEVGAGRICGLFVMVVRWAARLHQASPGWAANRQTPRRAWLRRGCSRAQSGCCRDSTAGHRRTRAIGTRRCSPGRVDRMASAMPAAPATSPARVPWSTAMMATGACGCSAAIRLSVVTKAVKPPRLAAARSSSSRSEPQLWSSADSTATTPSCSRSGRRRRGDTPTSRSTFTPGRQEGVAQSGLPAAAAQTADAPARRTAVAARRST